MANKKEVALSSISLVQKSLPIVSNINEGLSSQVDCEVIFSAHAPQNPGIGVFDESDVGEELRGEERGNAIFLPECWRKNSFDIDSLSLTFLSRPYVFGGRISRREAGFHFFGQTVITSDGSLVDGSYGTMDGNGDLPGDILCKGESEFKYQGPQFAEELSGTYYLIGNVHRHFGHVLLEGLTRLWALTHFRGDPSIRFAIYEDEIKPFALKLLEFAGVDLARIVTIPKAAIVEKLIVPSQSMRSHRWITAQQMDVWRAISTKAAGISQSAPTRKVYLSRKRIPDRPLKNELEVENFFVKQGFEVVFPETIDLQEQIKIANESRILAGPVGSQMYLAAFQQKNTGLFVVAPRNFYLRDDSLVASVNNARLRVCFGSSIDFKRAKEERDWCVDVAKLEKSYSIFQVGMEV
ncbi:glycosyltransferase family 61 protein [Burkholderia anthina]|uniref:glycosyltransferase family 61 protein n=1 Tax=Burkholderia anthina TaxID=179879 RepID=UPI00158C0D05|nr:glycosyltransferase family 61 protein [Burkholderia anthina]